MPLLTLDGSGDGTVANLVTTPGQRYVFALATEAANIGGTVTPYELTARGFRTAFQASLDDSTSLAISTASSRGVRLEFTATGTVFAFAIAGGTAALVVEYSLTPCFP